MLPCSSPLCAGMEVVLDCEIKADGTVPPGCDMESGAVLTLHDDAPPSPPHKAHMDTPAHAPAAPTAAPVSSAPAEVAPAAPSAPVAVSEPVAATVQPDPTTAAGELTQITQAAGGNAGLTVVLALVAVVGGGAAWKTYQRFSEQKHEQAMERLKIDAANAGIGGVQPPPCQVKQAEVDGKLAAFESRLAAAEKRAGGLSADFDGEDVERRIRKLEKAVKALEGA